MTDREIMQPAPPPECYTEEEKTAYAFGWWKAMEAQRLAQPEQKPVAWMVIGDGEYGEYTPGMHFDTVGNKEYWEMRGYELQPLYTTPPQRKPLTDEEIHDCFQQKNRDKVIERRRIARAIEAAHGIKGGT